MKTVLPGKNFSTINDCLVDQQKKDCHSERSRQQAAKSKNPLFLAGVRGERILRLPFDYAQGRSG